VEAADRVFRRYRPCSPDLDTARNRRTGHEFDSRARGVFEPQDPLVEPLEWPLHRDVAILESRFPVLERVGRDDERNRFDLGCSVPAGVAVGIREVRENRSWRPVRVAEIEVVLEDILEVYGLCDESETEHAAVEVDRRLGVPDDSRHVVESRRVGQHGASVRARSE